MMTQTAHPGFTNVDNFEPGARYFFTLDGGTQTTPGGAADNVDHHTLTLMELLLIYGYTFQMAHQLTKFWHCRMDVRLALRLSEITSNLR